MSVEVKKIDSENIDVNGKRVFKNHNEQWVSTVELTSQELNELCRHLVSLKREQETKD